MLFERRVLDEETTVCRRSNHVLLKNLEAGLWGTELSRGTKSATRRSISGMSGMVDWIDRLLSGLTGLSLKTCG